MEDVQGKLNAILFYQRCIKCRGFIFLMNFTLVDTKIECMIICPDCKLKDKVNVIP